MKGCNKALYENDEGKVCCGTYLSGGIMLCLECQNRHSPSINFTSKGEKK